MRRKQPKTPNVFAPSAPKNPKRVATRSASSRQEKHTPGPWFYSRVFKDEYGFDAATVGPFDTADHRGDGDHYEDTIASVSGLNHPCGANARLIAAAPELLEACREICESAGDAGWKRDSSLSVIATKLLDRVRAAIAKAEGV